MELTKDTLCCVETYGGAEKGRTCWWRATVIRNGKPYCTRHDPEKPPKVKSCCGAAVEKYRKDVLEKINVWKECYKTEFNGAVVILAFDRLIKELEAE